MERQDFGVPPTMQLHAGAMHGPTPASIPGGQVITTQGLAALIQGRQAPHVVFDVLGQRETLPGAVPAPWLAQPGSFDDQVQGQARALLRQQTQGRNDVALVFYCLSRECWMSYNAALRAINAGYTNVLWYRGGIEAWKAAGLPTQTGRQQDASQPGTSPPPGDAGPRGFVAVQPVARTPAGGGDRQRPAGQLRIGQSRFFSFALPPGWRVGEDGQFALTLLAPDGQAMTLMLGNAGVAPNYPPTRFAYEKLSAMQPQNLRIGQQRPARPAAGFQQAVEFEISYQARGIPYRGLAKVSVAPAYDSQTMALTAAISAEDQWPSYASWLPASAEQISANNGAAFGMRGIMQQNLQNSAAFGEAQRQYRDWSQKNWQGVTDQRNESQDRRNFAVRENLGGVQTFANPFGSPPVEMPMTYKHYWADRNGGYVGTNDPGADPNVGSTGEWRRMDRTGR
ncbi:PQQ-dependent catabolism-associated CXXCW motif protein [Stella humosa]|uniref:PQQ-dependent catabolism-associated CXXCW motif protein n=2 Tax=Stella humosa TaxID=94 RepID=A0A3N1MCT4_9PROT|nr:PQQ-dependent catabolism-associated CXXCW motif protein [Stella humosa]